MRPLNTCLISRNLKLLIIVPPNPKNGHFDNNVLKSSQIKTLCPTPACNNSASASTVQAPNAKNGHFDNKLFKTLHFKTIWITQACNIPLGGGGQDPLRVGSNC